jgi:hypothetical protein
MPLEHARIHRRFVVLAVAAAVVVGISAPIAAQVENPLIENTTDPSMVARQIRTALPTVERGYTMLTSSSDPESTAAAVALLLDSYRYLRAAQQSSENIQFKKGPFRDPTVDLRNKHIMEIRNHLGMCVSNRFYLLESAKIREECLDGLTAGIRKLRFIVVTLP